MNHTQTSNFKLQTSDKLAYSAEVTSATKAGQTSNFNFWCLLVGSYLVFGVWCLNFKRLQGASDAA